jgi:kynurenine formamidase
MPEGRPAKDISEFGPETFMGEAVFVDLKDLRPGDKITLEFIKQFGIKRGDIVLMGNAPTSGPAGAPAVPAADATASSGAGQPPLKAAMTAYVARFLGETGIKCFGLDWSFDMEPSFASLEAMRLHVELLGRDIPLIEGLCNLNQLRERRFYFVGLPYRVVGCDSWPVRAIAIEGVL